MSEGVEAHRTEVVAGLEEERRDLMEAVRQLGAYSAQFMPWDQVQVGDVVLSQSGLAEVIAPGSPDPEPEVGASGRSEIGRGGHSSIVGLAMKRTMKASPGEGSLGDSGDPLTPEDSSVWGEWGPAQWPVASRPGESTEDYRARAGAVGATHAARTVRGGLALAEATAPAWSADREPLPAGDAGIRRWGRNRTGHELDGHEWRQFPQPLVAA